MERARTEFLADRGIDVAEYHNNGYLFAVVDVDIHYKKSAGLGEVIDISTEMIKMTNVTIALRHQVFRNDTLLAEANVRLACINKKGKPQRIPAEFASLLSGKK